MGLQVNEPACQILLYDTTIYTTSRAAHVHLYHYYVIGERKRSTLTLAHPESVDCTLRVLLFC